MRHAEGQRVSGLLQEWPISVIQDQAGWAGFQRSYGPQQERSDSGSQLSSALSIANARYVMSSPNLSQNVWLQQRGKV